MFEKILKQIKSDIATVKRKDPAARNTLEILLTYSGLHAVLLYRVSHALYLRKLYTLARLISQIARFITGVEIHPGAKIGRGLFIDHGSGVVIGETAEIGNNCLIYQGVTLGGTGKERGKRHPTLGNNVMVGAGARVLGPFRVGNNVKIAANAVVLESIPDNCTAVGVPAKIVKRNGVRVNNNSDLDQIHIPDPVSQELCRHNLAIERLQKRIDELENAKATLLREPKKTTKKKDSV
jgi:serine O-acetyltransferase